MKHFSNEGCNYTEENIGYDSSPIGGFKEDNYMEDNVNGTEWHIPDKDKRVVNEDGSWNDKPEE